MNCAGCSALTAIRSFTRESRIADGDLAGQPVCAVRLRCRDRLRRLDALPAVRTGLNLGLQRFGRYIRSGCTISDGVNEQVLRLTQDDDAGPYRYEITGQDGE